MNVTIRHYRPLRMHNSNWRTCKNVLAAISSPPAASMTPYRHSMVSSVGVTGSLAQVLELPRRNVSRSNSLSYRIQLTSHEGCGGPGILTSPWCVTMTIVSANVHLLLGQWEWNRVDCPPCCPLDALCWTLSLLAVRNWVACSAGCAVRYLPAFGDCVGQPISILAVV